MAKGIKTGGREKGTPNKLSKTIRETLAELLAEYSKDTFKSDLNALTEHQRIRVITNLYRLMLPPMKAEVLDNNDGEGITHITVWGDGKCAKCKD